MENKDFSCKSVENTLKDVNSTKDGLTLDVAKIRLDKYGYNELKEKKKDSWIKIFFSQLKDPLIYVLFAAILFTIVISIYDTLKSIKDGNGFNFFETGDWPDVIIIFAVIILNAIIGTIQEIKANTSLEALKKMSSPESVVIRDGKKIKIKSKELVLGDVVYIEEGDTVGADLRLIETINLKCMESSLTGESNAVLKNANITFSDTIPLGDRVNMAYMSTTVSYGRGYGVVVGSAMDTQIGVIADALDSNTDSETPLQKVLARLSKFLGFLTIGIVLAVLLAEIIWIFIDDKSSDINMWIDAILSAISLAVAAVPEGLSAVVTIVLSLGVARMVKANTIVRKLPSVETLGAVSVVCSDKTGTLTQNKMTVLEAYVNNRVYMRNEFKNSNCSELELLAKGMTLCSNATVEGGAFGDPTEVALVNMAKEMGFSKIDLENETPRLDELPFDSVRKMMSTAHRGIIYTKGALDSILGHTTKILENGVIRDINDDDIKNIMETNKYFAKKALRTLALAYTNKDSILEEDLIFVGLCAMIDPPRPECRDAVLKFKEAGIKTIMITGDHKDTAFEIAKELSIVENIDDCYTGAQIDELSFEELQKVCLTARVFARVSPKNKVDIVKAFQANGNICAMTGDGVNDAPSLKQADIGIAMGITGTDVSKGAADMVLVDDNFASIEKACEEGRGMYENIKKTVLFLLSSNIAEVLVMFLLIVIGLPAPLIAIHLLWVNLVTDSLPAIALGMQPKEKDIMKNKPRNPNDSIFANGGLKTTLLYGTFLTLGVIIAYFIPAWTNGVYSLSNIKDYYESNEFILHQAQTMAFTTLAFSELFHMIGMSDVKKSFIHIFKDKNKMMFIAFFLGICLQLLVIEVPFLQKIFNTSNLTLRMWIWTAILSLIPLFMHEILNLGRRIFKKKL